MIIPNIWENIKCSKPPNREYVKSLSIWTPVIHLLPVNTYISSCILRTGKGHWQPPEFPGRLLTLCFCRKSGIGKTLRHVAENCHLIHLTEKIIIPVNTYYMINMGGSQWELRKTVSREWLHKIKIIDRTIPRLMLHQWTQLVWMKWGHPRYQRTTTPACMWLLNPFIPPTKSLFFANQKLL